MKRALLLAVGLCGAMGAVAQTSTAVPTFTRTYQADGKSYSYTVLGKDPQQGGTTTIPTVLVPVVLTVQVPMDTTGKKAVLDPANDLKKIEASPIFTSYAFPNGKTQYADAVMRAEFPDAKDWHTLLGKPTVLAPVQVSVPAGSGYVLTSKKTGRMLALVDSMYLQAEIFKQLPKQAPGTLVIAVTKNTSFYTYHDATECCSWGGHGVDSTGGSAQAFVISSYLDPQTVIEESDVQPISQQVEQFFRDPLHDPNYNIYRHRGEAAPGNTFPSWKRVAGASAEELPKNNSECSGTQLANPLSLMDPTDTNWPNTVPASKPYIAGQYHLQNVALLRWYARSANGPYSFPDAGALHAAAQPCPDRHHQDGGQFGAVTAATADTVQPIAETNGPNGHHLIGYWSGLGRIKDISPQWDIILVAFSTLEKDGPAGTMQYKVRGEVSADDFKADIKLKQSQGKHVMVSLGGGGAHFALENEEAKQNFIRSVEEVCSTYGFEGIDIDFETQALVLQPGDVDFRHPTSPSTVNLIAALRAIHDHFGSKFMVSLVPEGTQTSGGYAGYGGQFGSYLPIIEGLRDILAFTDTQDYNCPPIEGLDGEFYMPGSIAYHTAATELLLHGFDVGRDPKYHFDALPPEKVAVGFLNSDTTPGVVNGTMRYLITGNAGVPVAYKLRKADGYKTFRGAMFWTIDQDRRENYRFSNTVGPLLHSINSAK